MTNWIPYCLSVCLIGVDPSADIVVDAAQLTPIEQAELSTAESGVLTHLEVGEGTLVEEGQLLARIDDGEAQLLKERAETELMVAQTIAEDDIAVQFAKLTEEAARTELNRANESNEKFLNSVSQTEVERLKLQVDKSSLEILQALRKREIDKLTVRTKEHDLALSTLALKRRLLKAPFPGIVVQVKKHRGERVNPDTPVLRLIRMDRLRAESFIRASGSSSSWMGRPVSVTVQGAEPPIPPQTGQLVFISPEVDPVNGQVRVTAEIDNREGKLRPGQIVTLTISGRFTEPPPKESP